MFEKRRFKKFLTKCQEFDENDPKELKKEMTTKELYAKFDLEPGTADFTGHALALHLDDT